MHHNDIKCGEIVDDSCYTPKTVCSMKEDWGKLKFWASCSEFQDMG